MAEKTNTTVRAKCDPQATMNFNEAKHAVVGHILSLSFPNAGVTLKPDFPLADPEKPDVKIPCVGVVDLSEWTGDPTAPVFLPHRQSPDNASDFATALDSKAGGSQIDIEFEIYRYDHTVKKYFKHFSTDGKPVKCIITKGSDSTPDMEAALDIQQPMNHRIPLMLTANSEGEPQQLIVAQKAGAPMPFEFGINKAG